MASFAIQTLFRRYQRELLSFLRGRVGSPDVAADLTQDAFLRLLQVPGLGAIKDQRAYLFRTATNLANDHYRRLRVQPFAAIDDEAWRSLADAYPTPEAAAYARQKLRLLQKALDDLSPRARQVFLLARVEGLTYQEIGSRLGIAPQTAFAHLVNAMTRLSEVVQKT